MEFPMRAMVFLASVLFGIGLWATAAEAAVDIEVDLSHQTMHVTSGNGDTHVWPVSTARKGFVTPRGHYRVQSLQAMHYSRKYHNSPMPHSIFFNGGYAIHGTYATGSLGAPASHGCIRLSPDHAAQLYQMVEAEGARISITGSVGRGDAALARNHDDGQVASDTHHRSRHDRAYARRRSADEPPLAYAPLAPSYDDWMRDPFGNVTGY